MIKDTGVMPAPSVQGPRMSTLTTPAVQKSESHVTEALSAGIITHSFIHSDPESGPIALCTPRVWGTETDAEE